MVRVCAESIRIPSFLRDLLAQSAGLTRETTCNGSRLPPYIDDELRPIKPPTINEIKSTYAAFGSIHFRGIGHSIK
jgi:hypothetical protein